MTHVDGHLRLSTPYPVCSVKLSSLKLGWVTTGEVRVLSTFATILLHPLPFHRSLRLQPRSFVCRHAQPTTHTLTTISIHPFAHRRSSRKHSDFGSRVSMHTTCPVFSVIKHSRRRCGDCDVIVIQCQRRRQSTATGDTNMIIHSSDVGDNAE